MTSQQHPLPQANTSPRLLITRNLSGSQGRSPTRPLDSTPGGSAGSATNRGANMGGMASSLSPENSRATGPQRSGPVPLSSSSSSRRRSTGRLEPWPEEAVDNAYGLYSLHRMFDIVGAQLTHRDVRVLSFLFVDVIDEHVLQLLRIITRHDLLPYVTLRKRQAVCPDPVDKYLEETSVRYVSPRCGGESGGAAPHRRAGSQPVICCSPSGPQVCPPRAKPGPLLPSRKRKRTHTAADCREKQTCDIRLRVRAEYCQHESALQGNVFSNKQEALERQFERFNQANTILKSRDLGSIICDIKFSELTYLDAFWRDYINGSLLEALKGVFITDSLKQAVGHEAIKLLVNVDEEDYQAGRRKLLRNLAAGGGSAGSAGAREAAS
ncbi:hypothetical protein ANANG_G00246330 [Anguilla anguilla]|uniref:TRADD-like N-terminal domain-containing protein n=1 Tax=Anguilla anguilla TaxID=7936 RepID=A0A9D3LSH1_ANGAN|nr:hypothetical protein ANANG_G00246330 [Anguilla anguilla]